MGGHGRSHRWQWKSRTGESRKGPYMRANTTAAEKGVRGTMIRKWEKQRTPAMAIEKGREKRTPVRAMRANTTAAGSGVHGNVDRKQITDVRKVKIIRSRTQT